MVLEGKDESEILFTLFRKWEVDLYDHNEKQNKSFFLGLHAIQKFIGMRRAGFLNEWELVYIDGNPAVELSFCINFPDGFRYRGYFDAVLRHKITGKVAVLEVKSSSLSDIDDAVFKNSAQAIGYSIVLDVIFPDLSSYEAFYLIYKSKTLEYDFRPYTKSYLQRAVWIQELLLDIETIKLYAGANIYPMHGESCYSFFRQCEYFGLCTLSTDHLVKTLDEKSLDKINAEKYTVNLSLMDLLTAQLEKA